MVNEEQDKFISLKGTTRVQDMAIFEETFLPFLFFIGSVILPRERNVLEDCLTWFLKIKIGMEIHVQWIKFFERFSFST